MVAPLNGYYEFDEAGNVKLEFSETPTASKPSDVVRPTIREVQDFAMDGKFFIITYIFFLFNFYS